MKRPLPAGGLLYVGGILLARFLPLPPSGLFALSFGLLLLTLFRKSERAFFLSLLLVFTGWTNLSWRTAILAPHDLRAVVADRTELVSLLGTLRTTPTQRVLERAGQEQWRSLAQLDVTALRLGTGGWQPAVGCVLASTPGILGTNVYAGQLVVAKGVLRPPRNAVAEGLFDYRAYLAWQGIYYELQTESTNDWRVVLSAVRPRADRFRDWAQRTLARGLPAEDEPLRLLWAMTLGWQTALTGEVSEPFMRTGTMHIFAISGLHIALIAGMLVNVLRVARVPRGVCGVVVIPFIWFYTGATGWQSSAIRSTIMMTVIIAGWALKRPSDLLNSLAAAGFIILLWQPEQLFQASFQLSFFVVLSIALLLPALERVRQLCWRTDPLLPAELRPRWQRWLEPPGRLVGASLATSLAAWIGSLPLIAYYFHLVTPVSLLANLVIVPLSSLALMCNLASLFCGDWFPWLTVLFNHSGWFWMACMVRLSEWATALPGAYFYVRSPAPITFIVYYLLVFAAVTGWLFTPRRRVWAGLAVGGLAVLALVRWESERRTTRLTVLALGSGGAAFLDAPGHREDLVINCGNERAVDFVVKPFLRAQGVNRQAQLLLTHGNSRQVGGATQLRQEFSVLKTLTSSIRFRSPVYRQIVRDLERDPQRWRQINRGDRVDGWTVLHPEARDRFPLAGDHAVVLRGDVAGTRVLLLSNLGRAGQKALRERVPDLQADLVITGLAAGGEPIQDTLLDAIRPQAIILSAGESPARTPAGDPLRGRLARGRIPVLYTGDAGSITVTFRRGSWEVRSMDGTRLSGTPRAARESIPPATSGESR
ncbi:MAG: ComEC/Rec2 family competence protein [Limisphaerales bacterium]